MRRFIFDILEGLRIAARAVWVNKMRSLLTTLGIIIGIAAVTSMATIINGLNQQFEQSLASLGTDVLYVSKWPWGRNPNLDWWNYINRPQLDPSLAETISERSQYAARVAPLVNTSRTIRHKGRDISARIEASKPAYGIIRNVELGVGRFFTQVDERGARNVCVIGAKIAEALFPTATPLGKMVNVGRYPCRVIGVHAEKGSGLFGGNTSPDLRVMMPFSTFEKFFGISRWRDVSIMVQVPSVTAMTAAEDELIGIVRAARQVDPMEANNFEINEQEQIRATFTPVKIAIYGVGLFLTALALLVGGIGVMNIMFVSVKERTKEIGIRKAVGAKRRTIMLQFLIEAVIVCLIGGLVGIGLSAGVAFGINQLGFTAVMPGSTVAIAFGICVGVGVIFGIVPAWQAASAKPIQALRYE